MAFDGVISFSGQRTHHSTSDWQAYCRSLLALCIGILQTQNQIKAAMQTAQQVRIDTGDVLFDARMVTNEEPF